MLPSNKFSGTLAFLLLLLLIYDYGPKAFSPAFPHKECLGKYQLQSPDIFWGAVCSCL